MLGLCSYTMAHLGQRRGFELVDALDGCLALLLVATNLWGAYVYSTLYVQCMLKLFKVVSHM